MTETRLERHRSARSELIAKVRDLDAEIERLSSGQSPSPTMLPAEEVDLAVYRAWSNFERGVFDGQHPAYASRLKAEWTEALRNEGTVR